MTYSPDNLHHIQQQRRIWARRYDQTHDWRAFGILVNWILCESWAQGRAHG